MQEHVRANLCPGVAYCQNRENHRNLDVAMTTKLGTAKMQEHVGCILVSDANMQRTAVVVAYATLEGQCSLLGLQEHKNSVRATLGASMLMHRSLRILHLWAPSTATHHKTNELQSHDQVGC